MLLVILAGLVVVATVTLIDAKITIDQWKNRLQATAIALYEESAEADYIYEAYLVIKARLDRIERAMGR